MKIAIEIDESSIKGLALTLIGSLVVAKRMGNDKNAAAIRGLINGFYRHLSASERDDLYKGVEAAENLLDDKETMRDLLSFLTDL